MKNECQHYYIRLCRRNCFSSVTFGVSSSISATDNSKSFTISLHLSSVRPLRSHALHFNHKLTVKSTTPSDAVLVLVLVQFSGAIFCPPDCLSADVINTN